MTQYAVVLEIYNQLGEQFIANVMRPHVVVDGDENRVRFVLQQRYPGSKVVIAPKEVLLNNPFDLLSDDFDSESLIYV